MKKIKELNKVILLANAIEHFDTALYAFIIKIFADSFFQEGDQIVKIIMAYGVISISYLAKPFGSYFFTTSSSPIKYFKITLIGSSVLTIFISVIPTYSSVGWFATFLLIVLRSGLVFFTSGGNSIARTFITDQNDSHKMSTYYEISTIVGIIMAAFVSLFAIDHKYLWRIIYLSSGLIGIALASNIKNVDVHYVIEKDDAPSKVDIKKIMVVITNRILSNITYYIPFVLMNTLVPLVNSSISSHSMAGQNIFLLIIDFLLLWFVSMYKKDTRAERILSCSYLALSVVSIVIFFYLPALNTEAIFITKGIIVLIGVVIAVTQNIFFNQLFTNRFQRYSSIGNSIAISDAFLGKATPAICMMLYYHTGSTLAIGLYIGTVSITCILINKICL